MKLLFRNPAYRILTLSRFFNAFGASIFNLVFIVYASTLSQASFAVAMANIVMILPTFFTVFAGIRADYTRDKVKWMVYSGLFQAVLFFLAALVVQQASLFAFSSLCLINVISDIISDFAGGLRMPLIKEKVAEDDLMEAQFITYISAIGGQAFGVWLLTLSVNNFSLVAGINACFFLVSATILFLGKSKLSLSMSSADGENLKNEKLSIKDQFLTIYRNLRLVFLKSGQKNFGFMLFAVLLINSLGGALGGIYNIFFLSHSLLNFSYTEALFINQFCILVAIIISSLTGNDYFGKQSLPRLMMWATVGLSLVGLANLFNQVVLGLLFLFLTLYVSGKVSPKISTMLMKNLAPEVLARTSNFLGLLFTLSIPVGTACFSLVAVWNIQLTWMLFVGISLLAIILTGLNLKNDI
ncbi:TPA: transporter [Streptococcus pneumoniae]|uniref:transporter n=1 Tax=Streptococcus pneumoniae TaxID=1313 RepID=UPI00094FEE3B|nr:transporter [Streptococcus pneumoniae]VOS47853.1 major facilitator superfamily permease [Streptococcus pneumoniae]VPM74891.1 major facilitator superfamily permease [Streptococcus pneumoniae]VQI83308.1 major facilitator superfamily permease [Streptococcus pneumoniae]VRC72179.1 major facilitator superfamily permease [Streptococcus pneumoniae]VRK85681.1 major facilitator superfamily permease [Streptococcus pneumoniae]